MKRLLNTFDHGELVSAEALLSERGILTRSYYVGAKNYPDEWALDVCLDSQFEDASALLNNSDHEVAVPVDVDAVRHSENEASDESMLLVWGLKVLGAVAVIVIFLAVVLRNAANA